MQVFKPVSKWISVSLIDTSGTCVWVVGILGVQCSGEEYFMSKWRMLVLDS